MSLLAVLSLGTSSLAYELLLTRAFSISHGNHLSFMAISIAMLGFGASGTVYSLTAVRWQRGPAAFPSVCLLSSASTIGSFLLLGLIPLDYLRFPVDPLQFLFLLAAVAVLSLPFFFAGLGSCLAYVRSPEASGAVALASLAGSALGAAAPAVLLPPLGEGGAVAAAAVIPACAAALFSVHLLRRPGSPRAVLPQAGLAAAAVALAAVTVLLAIPGENGPLAVRPSPYKTLPQLLLAPGARVVSRSWSLWGSIAVVESPSLRFAPGLSLSSRTALPPQTGITMDGDGLTVLTGPGGAGLARETHAYAGYLLAGDPGSVLVIQRGGGLGVLCARAAGARRITVVVEQPGIAQVMRERGAPDVTVVRESPRSFLARSGESFDVIHVEDWGPSAAGMASLSSDSGLTVDAFRSYWRRLADRGVLIVSRRLLLPPSDSVRLFSAALEALRREAVPEAAAHCAVIRGWDTCSLLVSRRSLTPGLVSVLSGFARSMSFDLDWFPGVTEADTNLFNRVPGSPFFASYRAVAAGRAPEAALVLDVAPQGDDRPFPYRFVRWTRLGAFFKQTGGRMYALLLAGEFVSLVVFAATLALALPVLLLPLLAGRKSLAPEEHGRAGTGPADRGRTAAVRTGRGARFRLPVLFAALGLGFLFAEMGFINAFTILFSSPTVTLSVALGGLLAFAGIGGLASSRLPRQALAPLALGAALICLLTAAALPALVHALLPLSLAARIAGCVALLAAPSVLLGMPFPLAMRVCPEGGAPPGDGRTADRLGGAQAADRQPAATWAADRQRAAAWAANGAASVVAASASMLIALSLGTRALLLAAAAGYLLALAAALPVRRRRRSPRS